MDSFSTDDLFGSFGVASSAVQNVKKAVHIKFTDEDYDIVEIEKKEEECDDNDSSSASDSEQSVIEVSSCENSCIVPKESENAEKIDTESMNKLNDFLKSIGCLGVVVLTFEQKIDRLISAYNELLEENKKLKEFKSEQGQDGYLFAVDTQVSETDQQIPRYTVYGEDDSSQMQCSSNSAPKGVECFNCDGSHIVSECPLPLNQDRIKSKKLTLLRAIRDKEAKNKRYAVEEKFKAGVLSQDLRQALGLVDDQLPFWIYRMRQIGYPPGHLKQAYQEPSGLQMLDDDCNPLAHRNDRSKSGYYERSQIISYPGFNQPMPEGVADNHTQYGAPPFSPYQQKEVFIEHLNRTTMEMNDDKVKKQSGEFTVDDSTDAFDVVDVIESPDPSPKSTPENDDKMKECTVGEDMDISALNSAEESNLALQPNVYSSPAGAQSIHVHLGTPIMSAVLNCGEDSQLEENGSSSIASSAGLKPNLEAFSKGVNKFEYKEESLPCQGGGMKKLKEILKRR